LLFISILVVSQATIYFEDDFTKPNWESRWVVSEWKKSDGTAGTWDVTHGKFGNPEEDKGLHTSQDARFYAISAKFKDFSNKDKTLVLQYRVKHEQQIDCGGGYAKLLPAGTDQKNFNGDAAYNIMFGPDICGSSTRKVHVILTNKGKNHLTNKNIPCETDELSHLYTLILRPDNSYEVLIDNVQKASGKIDEDWDILAPKKIKDPKVSKPTDWVDEKEIADPEDKNLKDGMIFLKKLLTLKLRNLKIGMMI